jgi:hypothetical protein
MAADARHHSGTGGGEQAGSTRIALEREAVSVAAGAIGPIGPIAPSNSITPMNRTVAWETSCIHGYLPGGLSFGWEDFLQAGHGEQGEQGGQVRLHDPLEHVHPGVCPVVVSVRGLFISLIEVGIRESSRWPPSGSPLPWS